MSLLHQEEHDDAALGEELTKGTSHLAIASVVAAVAVAVAVAVYMIAGQKPPAATGEILSVWAHPLHTQTSGVDASGASVAQEKAFDQVFVFADVRLHNQSQGPLTVANILTNATLDDGIHSSYAATASDYDRTFVAYPDLKVPHGKPLPLDSVIDPGQTLEGTFVCAFKLNQQQWDARKALSFTFTLRYHPNLVLTAKVPITEQ